MKKAEHHSARLNSGGEAAAQHTTNFRWIALQRLRGFLVLPVFPVFPVFPALRYLRCFLFAIIIGMPVRSQAQQPVDLSLSRSTFFGLADNNSYLLDETTDAQGYIYGTGWCTSIPTTPGVYSSRNAGRKDVMVFKMDPSLGQVVWSTYIGGANDEAGGSIHLTTNGDIIVSGYTFSADFPVVGGVGKNYLQSDYCCGFVLKLSADGSQLLYSSILERITIADKGLQEAARGVICCLNSQNEVYAVTQYTTNSFTKNDMYYVKLSATGSVTYSRWYGGDGDDVPRDIILVQNSIYICGNTSSTNLLLQAGKFVDVQDAFILKATDNGSTVAPVRCEIFGSGGFDAAYALTYDPIHNGIVVCGTIYGSNIPIAASLQLGHNSGGFITSFDLGLLTQGGITILGQQVVPRSVAIQSTGLIYIGGYVVSNGTAPVTVNALQSIPQGNIDATLIVVDSAATKLLYGTYLGGTADEYSSVKVSLIPYGCFERVLVGLTTHSSNYPTTQDAYQYQKLNGDEDQPALTLFSSLSDERFNSSISICQQQITASILGACSYLSCRWDFGDGTADSLVNTVKHTYVKPGTYILRCRLIYPEPDTVEVVRVLTITGGIPVDAGLDFAKCSYETQVQLHATGAVSYTWTPSKLYDNPSSANPIVHPDSTTTYHVHGVDKNGCSSDDSVIVYVRSTKAFVSNDTSVCAGSSLSLHAFGGLNIQWIPDTSLTLITNNDVLVKPKKKTTYMVVVTNGQCLDTASIVVDVKPSPQLRMPVPQVVCPGEPTVLHAVLAPVNGSDTANARYTWTPQTEMDNPYTAQPTIRATENRWYFLDVQTPVGCSFRDSVFVTMRTSKSVSVIADTGMCTGEALHLFAKGADSYDWQPAEGLDNAQSSNPVCSIEHSIDYLVVSTIGPCIDTHRVHVDVHPRPTLSMMADTEICRGSAIQLRVLNPDPLLNYQWRAAPGLISGFGPIASALPMQNVTYVVQAQSSQYCISVDSVRVTVDSSFSIRVQSDTGFCAGEWCTVHLLSSFDSSTLYALQPSVAAFDTSLKQFRFVVQQAGQYIVRAMKNQCTAEDTVTISINPTVSLSSVQAPTSICRGSAAQLRLVANPATTQVQWLRGGVPDSLVDHAQSSVVSTVSLDSSCDFHVHCSAAGYCEIDTVIHIEVVEPPALSGGGSIHGCLGDSVVASLYCNQPVHVQWSPTIGLSSDTVLQPKIDLQGSRVYTIRVRNDAGCEDSASFAVAVDSAIDVSFRADTLYAQVGEAVHLGIYGKSTASILLDRDVLCVVPAAFFINTGEGDSSWVRNGLRYIRVPAHARQLDTTERLIGSIQGMCLLTTTNYAVSTVEVDSSETVTSGACTRFHSQSIAMNSSACLGSARGISAIQPLAMQLYPNPASHDVNVAIQGDSSTPYLIEFFDLLGSCLNRQTITASSVPHVYTLSLDPLPQGILFCRVSGGGRTIQRSIVHEWP